MTSPNIRRRRAERRGRYSEWWAALSLILKGYRLLAYRARLPGGEIDLIALKGRTIAFTEVKARKSEAAGLYAVTPTTQKRIAIAAAQWMARRPGLADYGWRFDVIIVRPWRWPIHKRDAFRPDSALTRS